MEYLPLEMIREHLGGIPPAPLPAPFAIRPYRPGDAATWLRLHRAADRYSRLTPRTFEEQFGTDEGLLARRQLYLADGHGEAIGTATAWFDDDYHGQPWGRIHWVAIVPDFQGRGLATPLLAAACRRLAELGHRRAYLDTATVRTAAVNLYLKFGFRPVVRSEDDLRAWGAVRPHIRPAYWRRAADAVPQLETAQEHQGRE
ncbi:MAG: GNAT family N-acetyltransferase [Candidatus Brocadiia bacterium]